jgi:hypothetical protein
MCHAIKCEICGEVLYFEEYYEHIKNCKPELEKPEIVIEEKE